MCNTVYEVSRSNQCRKSALIDCGANGGIVGLDIHCICKTDHHFDVKGIHNHQITDVNIVFACGEITAQHGDIIVIMNQYTHMSQGRTIHSVTQLESFGVTVDHHTLANHGHQHIITPEGHVVPLQVHSGLVYMDMHLFTYAEFNGPNQLPQIMLTSDADWVPSSIDH